MACQSDDESGIVRALEMSNPQKTEDVGKSVRMNEALKLRQKMNPSMRFKALHTSPRQTPSMFEDNEEDEVDEISPPMMNGVENAEPNVRGGGKDVDRGGSSRRGGGVAGRSALLARLNLKTETTRKEQKQRISSSQFQNQLSSRFKTTRHQVRRLASSDNED